MSSSISTPSMDGKHSFCQASQSQIKEVIFASNLWVPSGSIAIAIINSVVPIRKLAMLSGPLATANLIWCSAFIIASWLFLKRLIIKGNRPSVLTFGWGRESASSIPEITFSAWGRLLSRKTILEPNADGSVHIPYSDQKPGMNQTSGNKLTAFRFDFSQSSSDE